MKDPTCHAATKTGEAKLKIDMYIFFKKENKTSPTGANPTVLNWP